MAHKICSSLEKIGQMWIRQLPLFMMLVLYTTLPTYAISFYSMKTYLAIVLPQVVLPSLLLCLLADRRRWLWWAVFIFGNLLWLLETGCYFCRHERVWSYLGLLVAQTSPNESGEYLSTVYPEILKALLVVVACASVFYLSDRLWRRYSVKLTGNFQARRSHIPMISAGVLLSLSVVYSPLAIYSVVSKDKGYRQRIARIWEYSTSSSWIMYAYVLNDVFNNPDTNSVPALISTLASTEVTSGNTGDSLTIVYVIGESFPRSRSSLYGYPYDTNPLLARELADSSLILFSNIISRSDYTFDVYRYMMSTCDPLGERPFESYPLLPALMKKAGYKVAYFDNQSLISDGWIDMSSSYFLINKKVRDFCFDIYNKELAQYDGDFVVSHAPMTADAGTNSITLYHLYGQHTLYNQRYPATHSHFTGDDYSHYEGLSAKGAQTMAEYDNATRYNDFVIHSIIDKLRDKTAVLVYSPDHGEETYDYRESYGRFTAPPISSLRLYHEVPVMIWTSDRFMQKYPEKIAALRKNTDKAIYNSDLPHTILDLAGIRTATFNPGLSLLRDGKGRPYRLLLNGINYDASRDELHSQKFRYETND